jgi:SAM-dependent methyltransferase
MNDLTELKPPDDLDWHIWLNRHDRMQKRYFMMRDVRFELISRLISETQKHPIRVLDLGCGAGGLMYSILEALPQAEVMGIDFDPTFLWLSGARLKRFGKRCRLIMADFLDTSWPNTVGGALAAVVSAQTFHMLDSSQLAPLYRRIAQVLRPGGIFLSADHARSDSAAIQKAWEHMRAEVGVQEAEQDSDDWDSFWKGYSEALGVDVSKIHERLYGGRKRGKKERLPLVWHLSRMLENGFDSVDCFWRSEYDVVYGGQRSP